MEKRKLFDQDLVERPFTTALEAATEWSLFGLKWAGAIQEESIRTAHALLERSESVLARNRQLAEEFIALNKRFATEFQRSWFEGLNQTADALKPEPKAAASEKKSA